MKTVNPIRRSAYNVVNKKKEDDFMNYQTSPLLQRLWDKMPDNSEADRRVLKALKSNPSEYVAYTREMSQNNSKNLARVAREEADKNGETIDNPKVIDKIVDRLSDIYDIEDTYQDVLENAMGSINMGIYNQDFLIEDMEVTMDIVTELIARLRMMEDLLAEYPKFHIPHDRY